MKKNVEKRENGGQGRRRYLCCGLKHISTADFFQGTGRHTYGFPLLWSLNLGFGPKMRNNNGMIPIAE